MALIAVLCNPTMWHNYGRVPILMDKWWGWALLQVFVKTPDIALFKKQAILFCKCVCCRHTSWGIILVHCTTPRRPTLLCAQPLLARQRLFRRHLSTASHIILYNNLVLANVLIATVSAICFCIIGKTKAAKLRG